MYTIFQNSTEEGFDLESFSKRMIDICNDHRKQNRAMAFAFILYDFQNPQVWKVLNDREYWLALNAISGKFLTVFSLNYRPPERRKRRRDDSDTYIHMLTDIRTTFNPSEGTNALIDKYFGEQLEVSYPAILFFQVNQNAVVDSLLIELREQEIEPAFLEMQEYIIRAVEALRRIQSENKGNIKEIFDCLEHEVRSARNVRRFKRVAKGAGGIVDLISSIKGLW
jgi:hypothetical protein